MAREYTKYTGMNLKWSDDKVKTKEITGCSEINRRMIHVSDFSTPFFFPTCHALVTWFVRVTEGKITVSV